MVTEDDVITVLRTIDTSAVPINVWDLGLVYDVKVDAGEVWIRMTRAVTDRTFNDVLAQEMANEVGKKLRKTDGYKTVIHVEVVLEPHWTPDMMSDEAKAKLGWGTATEATGGWQCRMLSRMANKVKEEKEKQFQEHRKAFPAGEEILLEKDFTSYLLKRDRWRCSGLFISARRIVFGCPQSSWGSRQTGGSLEFEDGESFIRVVNEMTSIVTTMDVSGVISETISDAIACRIMFVLTPKRLIALRLVPSGFSYQAIPFEENEEILDHVGDIFGKYGKYIRTTRKVHYVRVQKGTGNVFLNHEVFAPGDEVSVSLASKKRLLGITWHLTITKMLGGERNFEFVFIGENDLPFARKVQEMLVKAAGATASPVSQ